MPQLSGDPHVSPSDTQIYNFSHNHRQRQQFFSLPAKSFEELYTFNARRIKGKFRFLELPVELLVLS